jgi:hypothetical protein
VLRHEWVMQREEPLRDCRKNLKAFWNIPGFSEVFPPVFEELTLN